MPSDEELARAEISRRLTPLVNQITILNRKIDELRVLALMAKKDSLKRHRIPKKDWKKFGVKDA